MMANENVCVPVYPYNNKHGTDTMAQYSLNTSESYVRRLLLDENCTCYASRLGENGSELYAGGISMRYSGPVNDQKLRTRFPSTITIASLNYNANNVGSENLIFFC